MPKKKVNLDKLIEDLDPEKINEDIGMQHADIRNNYKIDNIKATNWDDFKDQIIKYVKNHHKKIYKTDMPDEMAYSKAREVLEQMRDKNGNRIGFLGAYELARKGKLPKVIDELSDAFEGEHTRAYTTHVMEQIDPLDFKQHVELVKEYRAKYSQFLPKGMNKKSDAELARDYQGLIKHHASVVQKVKGNMEEYEAKVKKFEPKYEKAA